MEVDQQRFIGDIGANDATGSAPRYHSTPKLLLTIFVGLPHHIAAVFPLHLSHNKLIEIGMDAITQPNLIRDHDLDNLRKRDLRVIN